ncbi:MULTISPECIES: 2-dehydropantoate 2-reductase [unclassified Microbacterium]|uniref:ketopantoate reductase family protein n=1 Tax=unclassified Microbacterium TaxID=2609290 RepID=UPI00214C91A1|nr:MULTISPECIES: 2-dehydropantoate 2-reductase [unclassified Microbacterium]MCR2810441.1 2-dehydropantoate 2-reductase [Microbacterium sp. zg.B185]WIM18493.1 2-dehydropantoate 2-reductase [Microbacterium sp. zg-B185]
MRSVAILGAGAMGRLFAARLAEAGIDVTLVDVDAGLLRDLGDRGVRLEDDAGVREVAVRVSPAHELSGTAQLYVIFTKGMHTRSAVASIAGMAGAGAGVLTLQNGLGNPEIIAEAFPADRIIKGVASLPADAEGTTGVRSLGKGHLDVGAFAAGGEAWAGEVAEVLASAGFDVRLPADIDAAIWEKLAFNTALNVPAALTGLSNAGMDNPPGRRVITRLVDEVLAVAHAQGVSADGARIHAAIDHALVAHADHRASMLQDVIAGRPAEIESIPGAVLERARHAKLPVPVLESFTDALRMAAGGRR